MRSELWGSGLDSSLRFQVLKGRGFSRAATALHANVALAVEGMHVVANRFPHGLKPNRLFTDLAARLKPRPFKAENLLADRAFSVCEERTCGR
jgi:hypothetical protein